MKKCDVTKICLGVLVVMAFCFVASQQLMATEKFTLKKGDQEWLTFEIQKDGGKAASPTLSVTVKRKADKYEFTTPSAVYLMKTKEEGKFKIYKPDGALLFKVKIDGEKRKISQTEDDKDAWSMKLKDDNQRYKVEKSETELGQVKFYSDNSKIKVKDPSDVERCSMQSDRLRSAPAVCLFTDLTEEQQLILFTLLMIVD